MTSIKEGIRNSLFVLSVSKKVVGDDDDDDDDNNNDDMINVDRDMIKEFKASISVVSVTGDSTRRHS